METSNAELGGTIQNVIINDLSLNRRDLENLLSLRLGPTVYPGGGRTQRQWHACPRQGNSDSWCLRALSSGSDSAPQFRAEFFNVPNHPEFTNPNGVAGAGFNEPSVGPGFGCGCLTTQTGAGNPIIGSGGPRAIQLGLKLIFYSWTALKIFAGRGGRAL